MQAYNKKVERIYIYGGCATDPNKPETANMVSLGSALARKYPAVEVFVVRYQTFTVNEQNDTVDVTPEVNQPKYAFIDVNGNLVEGHKFHLDHATVVIGHSYGCLVAMRDIAAGQGADVFLFIALSPFSIRDYVDSENVKEEESLAFRYKETVNLLELDLWHRIVVILGEREYQYNREGVTSLVRGKNTPLITEIPDGSHGLSLWNLDTDVALNLLKAIEFHIMNAHREGYTST